MVTEGKGGRKQKKMNNRGNERQKEDTSKIAVEI